MRAFAGAHRIGNRCFFFCPPRTDSNRRCRVTRRNSVSKCLHEVIFSSKDGICHFMTWTRKKESHLGYRWGNYRSIEQRPAKVPMALLTQESPALKGSKSQASLFITSWRAGSHGAPCSPLRLKCKTLPISLPCGCSRVLPAAELDLPFKAFWTGRSAAIRGLQSCTLRHFADPFRLHRASSL